MQRHEYKSFVLTYFEKYKITATKLLKTKYFRKEVKLLHEGTDTDKGMTHLHKIINEVLEAEKNKFKYKFYQNTIIFCYRTRYFPLNKNIMSKFSKIKDNKTCF